MRLEHLNTELKDVLFPPLHNADQKALSDGHRKPKGEGPTKPGILAIYLHNSNTKMSNSYQLGGCLEQPTLYYTGELEWSRKEVLVKQQDQELQ